MAAVRPLQVMKLDKRARRAVDRRARRYGTASRPPRRGHQDRHHRHRHRLHARELRRPRHRRRVQRGKRGRHAAGRRRRCSARPRRASRAASTSSATTTTPTRTTRRYQPVPHPGSEPARLQRARLARRGHRGGLRRARERHTYTGPYNANTISAQLVDDRPGRRAEGRPLRDPRLRLRGLDRRHRRRHRVGRRQRHGRHQHVARLAVRHRRTTRRPSPRRTRRRPA